MTLFTDAGESEFGGNISNLSSLVSASNLCTELYFDVEVAYGIPYWIYSQPILLKISMYYLHSILLSLTDSFIFSNAVCEFLAYNCTATAGSTVPPKSLLIFFSFFIEYSNKALYSLNSTS